MEIPYTFFKKRFLGSIFLLFSFFLLPDAYGKGHEITPAINRLELKAAELYASSKGYGKVDVYLKVYYNENTEIFPASEYVSVYESLVHSPATILELKQDTTFIQGPIIPLACNTRLDNKLRAVYYYSELDLGLMHTSYDLTWGFCCLDPMIKNMDVLERKALALTIHLENNRMEDKNAMPYFTEIPVHKICTNTSSSFTLKLKDNDGDETKLSFSTPGSSETTDKIKQDYQITELPTTDRKEMDMSFFGSFLTRRPPFVPLSFAKGYSEENPIVSKKLSLDSKTGELSYTNIADRGMYLVTFSVSDYDNTQKMSDHQLLLILEIF